MKTEMMFRKGKWGRSKLVKSHPCISGGCEGRTSGFYCDECKVKLERRERLRMVQEEETIEDED